MPNFEAQCIDFVLSELENVFDGCRSNVESPEDDPAVPIDKRIDAVASIGSRCFAIEHSLVEAFEGQIGGNKKAGEIENNLRAELSDFQFKVGIDVVLSSEGLREIGSGNRRNDFAKQLAATLRKESKLIEGLADDDRFVFLSEVMEIPVKVVRNGFEEFDTDDTKPYLLLSAPPNRSNLTKDRFGRLIERKLPKLCRWSDTHQTVLIIENQDISLSSWRSARSLLEECWPEGNDIPIDYVYYLNCSLVKTCRLYPFVQGRQWVGSKPSGLVRSIQRQTCELRNKIVKG